MSTREKIIRENSLYVESPECLADPVVSVLMWVYNHASTIRQAVESVLEQEGDFPFELVISDDCSTDGTTELLKQYQQEAPDRTRLILSTRNLWKEKVITERLLTAARGRYAALHHGDDAWIDRFKLRKQVEFLDRHPECSGCFHNTRIERGERHYSWFADSPQYADQLRVPKAALTPANLIYGNVVPTATAMYRADVLKHLPDWLCDVVGGDWAMSVIAAARGPLGYLPETMACYRADSGGAWSGLPGRLRWEGTLKQMELHQAFLGPEFAALCQKGQGTVLQHMRQDAVHLATRLCRENPSLSLNQFAEKCADAVVLELIDLREVWRLGVEAAFFAALRSGSRPASRRLFRKWVAAEPGTLLNRHVLRLAFDLLKGA